MAVFAFQGGHGNAGADAGDAHGQGGGDHADAGTVRLGRPILPSSLCLGIALIIGYL